MRRLKTSWTSDVLSPGFFLLVALLLVDLSLLTYRCEKPAEGLTCILLGLYLFCLLVHKYARLRWLVGLFLLLALVTAGMHKKSADRTDAMPATIRLYPDQVKVDGDWLAGEGATSRGKVLVSGTVTKKQLHQVDRGHQLILTEPSGRVEAIAPASNYGQFDSKQYYASKNIWRQVKLSSCRLLVKGGGIADFFHHLRFNVQKYFERMPRILRFFSSELILGENPDRDNQELLDNYRDLGVIHILSISGLHVGIYTLVISTICFCLKRTEEETFVCCLAFLLLGVFLSAGQAGFVRASLTYILGQLFKFKKVKIARYDLLGLTCLFHLLLEPRLMTGTGAVLSYLLALGLEMTSKMSAIKRSLALNCLLTPLLLFYFFQFNFLTVVFNMVVVPYFNGVVLPLTFANLVLFAFIPGVSTVFERFLQTCEALIGKLALTKAGLLTFGKINWWQCLLLMLLTSAVLLCINDHVLRPRARHRFVLGVTFLYGLLFSVIHFPLRGQVTIIDVGQGDSILVTTPFPRRVYMIDVGGRLNFGGKKITPQVNKITVPLLKAQGISRIDGLFVTHQDADHVGDLAPLLEQVPVGKLYTAKGLLANPSFRRRVAGRLHDKQVVELLAGQQVREPQIRFNVLYPFVPGLGKNEDSLTLAFKVAGKSWLFTGDLGQDQEEEIATHYNLAVDYFKLGHHGSRTASSPHFLQTLHPKLVFVSAGRNNRFNHPHPETVATLKRQHIPWASTQDCGMITWSYGGFARPRFGRYLPKKRK